MPSPSRPERMTTRDRSVIESLLGNIATADGVILEAKKAKRDSLKELIYTLRQHQGDRAPFKGKAIALAFKGENSPIQPQTKAYEVKTGYYEIGALDHVKLTPSQKPQQIVWLHPEFPNPDDPIVGYGIPIEPEYLQIPTYAEARAALKIRNQPPSNSF